MPDRLAEHHSEMVFWSFERSRAEDLQRKSQVLSFGKNRHGFIFSIKLFLGFSLRTYNDFILHAGVLSMDEKDKGVLFDDSGEIMGVSQSFFKLLTEQYESITVKKLECLSIFSLIEGLRESIQKNHGFPEKGDLLATNLPGSLILPSNLVGQFYQNHDNRLKYFYTTMNARLVDIVNFKGDLFNFALEAKSIINDDVYNEIMEGDTCNGLRDKGFFNDDQYNYCKTKLVQFKNGMIMIVNNYVNVLRGDTFINLKNQSSDIDLIRTFISTTSQQDKIIANYYLSVSLQYFYDYSSTYYSTVLNTQLGNLRLVIWAVSVICMALLLVIGGLSYRFLSEGYKIASCGLGLLPYEKLAHDEQTIFLIRRFWKEHSS